LDYLAIDANDRRGPPVQKLRSIQVLRAAAILPVVFFHFSHFAIGRSGVDLFFCISGFVMAGQMKRTPAQFAMDRVTRIYPPFLAAMALFFAVHPMIPDPARFARSLLLFPDYHAVYLYPAWSLGYEAMFYSACVAAMFVGGRTIIAVYAILFALQVPYAGSGMCLEFLAGFAIARKQWWAVALLFVAAWLGPHWRPFLYGVPAAFMLWICTRNERWFASEKWAPVVLIGDASYAIYLTHTIVGDMLLQWHLVVVVYAVLTVGMAFHFGVEKPLVRFARWSQRKVSPATA
jgi:exopolysaccharide production protein ExoZ